MNKEKKNKIIFSKKIPKKKIEVYCVDNSHLNIEISKIYTSSSNKLLCKKKKLNKLQFINKFAKEFNF